MLKKLLDLRVILVVLLIVSWVIAVLFFMNYKDDMTAQLAAKDSEIETLNAEITSVGELVPAYTIAEDVPSGKKIEESDLVPIDVPISMATNLAQDPEELIGKHFKLGMTAGTVITTDCVYEEVLTYNQRYLDVICDTIPIGLQVGSFVDIRIQYGFGGDYLAIPHRQVQEINGNVLKLIVSEEDIHMYSNMIVENIVFNEPIEYYTGEYEKDGERETAKITIGCRVYAIEYVEGGIQEGSSSYYSPTKFVQALMQADPNMISASRNPADMEIQRLLIEKGMVNVKDLIIAEDLRDTIRKAITDGNKVYLERLEAEAKAAAEEGN